MILNINLNFIRNKKIVEIFREEKYSRFLYNILLSIFCIFAFFTPDYILKFAGASRVEIEISFIIAFFSFGFVLSMIRNKKVVLGVVSVFFIFELIQLHYMAYFGTPISPVEIKKIFTETCDIAESGFKYFYTVWYVLPTMLVSYGLYLYVYTKFSNRCFKTRIAYILLIIILLIKPERAHRKTLKHFLPGPTRNSIHNTLNTFSYFFVKELWNSNSQKKILFEKYEITKVNNFKKPDIVIFLVAESMNYKHLSLFGYERETTLNLNRLKNDSNFMYRKALSSSISTASSLPFLFNIIREPGNFRVLSSKENNLLKLAKENNFDVYFFTSQESKILNDLGINYADMIIAKENNIIEFLNKRDDMLLEYLDFALNDKKNNNKFISIFQRNLHSPYETNYKKHKEFDIYDTNQNKRIDKAINSYDNAVLYEDYFVNEIIGRINKLKDKSVIFIMTADHGQMLGEDNLFGHNMLDYRVAEVPFIIFFNNKYNNIVGKIPNNISHYEISKIVAKIIGYNVINPNENGEYFIQGNDVYFDNFILPYTRKDDNELVFKKISSTYKYFEKLIY